MLKEHRLTRIIPLIAVLSALALWISLALAQGSPPSVQFESATASVNEKETAVFLKLTRTGNTSGTSSGTFATGISGTATEGKDYTGAKDVGFSFASGETEKLIEIKLLADTAAEVDETFTVSLKPGFNCSIGRQGSCTVTIVDDDTMPTIQLAANSYSIDEPSSLPSTAPIRVTLNRLYSNDVSVD